MTETFKTSSGRVAAVRTMSIGARLYVSVSWGGGYSEEDKQEIEAEWKRRYPSVQYSSAEVEDDEQAAKLARRFLGGAMG